ncbi:E3 ubiquitin-protein ligase TRIM71-like [Oopsacas minuta]|uniref:E3 ubiquitin-protein ligase TRIM71-like n=1 Tax=Oopsacas minuta TaxID=111878 RepID=A0AAV7JK81_9METZ|nr:E3 ubiquitin-protein ligase TRIM71-like [Oopsacas minuta]
MIYRLNQRRVELLNSYHFTKNEIASRPLARVRKEEELLGLRADTERRIQTNELRELQERIITDVEQTLAEVRSHQPDTRPVFLYDSAHLEEVISGVGVIVEEEIPVVPSYELMRPVVTIGKKGTTLGELWNPWSVAIDENTDFIYVTECFDPSIISIFSETGDFLNTFTHQNMREPYGIAIHRDNLYVTDIEIHALLHFEFEAGLRLVTMFGSGKGSADDQFKYPHGLAVYNNGDLYITDSCNHRVKIIDSSLSFKTHITHQIMRRPLDIKLTHDEVYVLCNQSPCIHVFSHAGEIIRSIVAGDEVIHSSFFCLDVNQNLLVSDWGDDKVKIFSKDGTLLYTLGQRGDEAGMFVHPRGIVLTKI